MATILEFSPIRKMIGAGIAGIAAMSIAAATAQAASITFVFDYGDTPPHTALSPPVPGGPFGTITLTDSLIDPNRVDISLTAAPPAAYVGALFERFLLNFDLASLPANRQGYFVDPATGPTGITFTPFTAAQTIGIVSGWGNNTQTAGQFAFDVNTVPDENGYIIIGSLSLYNTNPPGVGPPEPVDLSVSMFNLTSTGDGTPPMYAAYRLSNFNVNPNDPNNPDGEFWAFASSVSPPGEQVPGTPLPGAVWLFGTVIAGGVGYGRWRKKRKQAA